MVNFRIKRKWRGLPRHLLNHYPNAEESRAGGDILSHLTYNGNIVSAN